MGFDSQDASLFLTCHPGKTLDTFGMAGSVHGQFTVSKLSGKLQELFCKEKEQWIQKEVPVEWKYTNILQNIITCSMYTFSRMILFQKLVFKLFL